MRIFLLSMVLILSSQAFANLERTIQFNGQNGETLTEKKELDIFRSEPREIDTTCYRDIPYQSYECRNETRYRQECHYVPSRQECRTEYERQCRTVTRTRQQCTTNPGRQVCTERPTREVCRVDSSGQNRCTTVGGGQSCTTVGGGQTCTSVPYQDTECSNVPRQSCHTIPGGNVCNQVPYYEEVCGYETRYRSEGYACRQTVMRDIPYKKQFIANVDVRIITNGIVEEFPLTVKAAAKNKYYENFALDINLGKQPEALVVVRSKKLEAKEEGNVITLDGSVVIEIVSPEMVSPSFPVKFSKPKLSAQSVLSLEFDGSYSATGSLQLELLTNPTIGKDKVAAKLNEEYPSERIVFEGNKVSINLNGKMERKLTKKNSIKIKLKAPVAIQGDILNEKKPSVEKSYQISFKK